MVDIFDTDGNRIAAIPLSEKQLDQLHSGLAVNVQWHTPQLLRSGGPSGNFSLRLIEDKFVTTEPDQARQCASMLAMQRGGD